MYLVCSHIFFIYLIIICQLCRSIGPIIDQKDNQKLHPRWQQFHGGPDSVMDNGHRHLHIRPGEHSAVATGSSNGLMARADREKEERVAAAHCDLCEKLQRGETHFTLPAEVAEELIRRQREQQRYHHHQHGGGYIDHSGSSGPPTITKRSASRVIKLNPTQINSIRRSEKFREKLRRKLHEVRIATQMAELRIINRISFMDDRLAQSRDQIDLIRLNTAGAFRYNKTLDYFF